METTEDTKIQCVEMTCEGRALDHHYGDPGCSYEATVQITEAGWVKQGLLYDERLSDEALNGPRVDPTPPFSIGGTPQS